MPAERRDVLRLCGVGLVGTVAGCLDAEGVHIDGTGDTSTPEPTPEPTPDAEPDAPEPLEGPVGDLAEATRRVIDEAAWFGTEYDDAIEEYTAALDRAIETVFQLENTTSITDGDVDRLEEVMAHVERTVETHIEPHFRLRRRIEQRNERAITRVERFGERGDRPAVNDELESLRGFYERFRGLIFRQRNLSRDPIRNRLVTFMSVDGTDVDDEDDDVHDTLFEFRYLNPVRFVDGRRALNGYRFRTRVHTEQAITDRNDPRILGDPASSPAGSTRWPPTYTFPERFAPVAVAEDRVDELEVVINDWSEYDGSPRGVYTDRFRSWPVYLQRYEDREAAAAARSALLDGPVFLEADRGTSLGALAWAQARYRLDGHVMYALFKQFGEFVVVVAPARTPIEDRHAPSRTSVDSRRPEEAVVIRENGPVRVPTERVAAGDELRVAPGQLIPVDGVVVEGESTVDESVLNGGSASAEKSPGDEVTGSTRNVERVIFIEAAEYVDDPWTAALERSWLHVGGDA